jgi:hypothetical protein
LRCFPRDDPEFAAAVASALGTGSTDEVAVLEQLKWQYPHVRIVRRDALASIRGDRDVIYAYLRVESSLRPYSGPAVSHRRGTWT